MPTDSVEAALPPRPSSSLRSISLVTLLTLVQLVLQFGLQLVLARYYGAAGEMDAYVAALALPVVIATILASSLGYVLVPIVADRLASRGERDAAIVASQIGWYVLLLAAGLTLLTATLADWLIAWLCPGFSPAERKLAAELLRVLSLLIVANSLISYLNSLLHAYQQFTRPAVAGVVGTLAALIYVVAFHERQGIFAVARGVVIGAALTVALLVPRFLDQLWCYSSWKQPPHAGTRQCLWLLLPLTLGAIYWRLDPLIDRYLGSYLAAGSLAQLGYAWRLASGLMLIGTSGLSIVAFPALAAHAAAGRRAAVAAELAHAIRFLLFLMIPVGVGVVAFRVPIVRLLYERGRFTPSDTLIVASLLALYAGAILGAGISDLLSRTCFAHRDALTPVIANSMSFTIAAGLKFLLVGKLGAGGLALATSGFYGLSIAILLVVVLRVHSRGVLAGAASTLLRALISAPVGCAAAAVVMQLPVAWAVLPAAASGAGVYLLVMGASGDEFALKLLGRLRGA